MNTARTEAAIPRRIKAWFLRRSGWKYREIGAYFGVSAGRARQIAQVGARIERRRIRYAS